MRWWQIWWWWRRRQQSWSIPGVTTTGRERAARSNHFAANLPTFGPCPLLHHFVLVLLFIMIIIITMIMIVIFAANLPTFDPCLFHHHHHCLDRHHSHDHHDLDQSNEISPSFWRFASGLGEFGSCQEFQSPRIEDLGRDWRKVENKKHSKSTNFNILQTRTWGICEENLWRHIVKRAQFGSLVTNEV